MHAASSMGHLEVVRLLCGSSAAAMIIPLRQTYLYAPSIFMFIFMKCSLMSRGRSPPLRGRRQPGQGGARRRHGPLIIAITTPITTVTTITGIITKPIVYYY